MNKDDKKASSVGDAYRAVGPYLTLGIQLVITILLCLFAGRWVDGKFDSSPVFTLVGGLFGIAAGFYHFFKEVLRVDHKAGDDDK
ncbi:MAG: AtpZ/AtpI family protein [Candidatus Latescibacteria bacterium]|jgi:F0F1-type ATP synthase assembly protein I|nr:AtpZ/AtpI family protein [Candidatus Latescibacterota bacterium]